MTFYPVSPCQNILENRSEYIDSLYNSCFEKVKKMVINNSGTEDDAHDIFQDAFVALFQNCKKADFILTSHPCTFLFSTSYKMWLKELERRSKVIKIKAKFTDENIAYNDDPHMKRERLVAKYFLLVAERCRQILQLSYIDGLKGKVVAERLGFKSNEYYRIAKQRCIDGFFKVLKNDTDWNDINS